MKVKLLKKLRKRFGIVLTNGLYYPVDNKSLHWDETYPYYYLPLKTLEEAQNKRRELILEHLPKKVKIIV